MEAFSKNLNSLNVMSRVIVWMYVGKVTYFSSWLSTAHSWLFEWGIYLGNSLGSEVVAGCS